MYKRQGIFRPAGFAIGGDAPPDDALPLPPDGGVDDARPEGKFSFYNGVVELFHPLSQQRGGVAILSRQHEAAGVLVDAGRTHQIRVHFASIGHPLAGDDLYGGSRARIGRQALHCAKQTFWVPCCEPMPNGIGIEVPVDETTLRPVTVESPLPEDMTKLFV